MAMTRREFGALGAASIFAPGAFAQTAIGDFTVTSVSDGSLTLPADMILGQLAPEQLSGLQDAFGFEDVLTPPCNVTLLQTSDRNVLFDVGAGPEFMSSAGFLMDALDAQGLAPEDITDVVFTHAHPDHIWGLLDDFDDLLFSDARYMIGQTEWDYWTDPATVDTIGEARTAFAVGAARRLARIEDAVTFFRDGEEIMPGVAARATFGHTPGHMAFEVRQGSEALMILGDCIGNHHAAFRYPQSPSGADQDQDMGAVTRTALLDQLASEQMRVLGFHLPGNGIGRVERDGAAYRFVEEG
ncbi:MBL fold metallo-hydrolase [Cognatiyoonia sp. IB215182]|uniref:MBL fold metallo-hydrolase n=1 Tax=Cognatiyoonia sp. IB215182 TaxID=3097353 RepID=UPI002A175265|nr:MBL fold metallo-hydrolase [Cognatiyoonia sp. IB215182]MDX8350855.1 MBL fold metallo-hydrolase [Cognatiyoonia sp. IB215182]